MVGQTYARGVAARRGVEHFDERLDKDRRRIHLPGVTATVLLQLLAIDALRDVGKRHALTSKLYLLGFPQEGQVTCIPLEDADIKY